MADPPQRNLAHGEFVLLGCFLQVLERRPLSEVSERDGEYWTHMRVVEVALSSSEHRDGA